jgi:hypothetical protein
MSASQRRKGMAGERAAAKLLSEEFGTVCRRTLDQPRDGGCDIDLPPFSVEVKTHKSPVICGWIEQAQKAHPERIPLVMVKGNNKPWLCVVPWEYARKWLREEM